MVILGLMSGTSMDGVDCCLADINIDNNDNLQFNVIDFITYPYDDKTIKILHDTIFLKKNSKEYIDKYLAKIYSVIIKDFLKNRKVSLISIHGQTISHKDKKYSIQACCPRIVFENFNIPVVDNFRMKDIKNGGNGAPLVPILDWYLFKNNINNTIAINIGGISNISFIPTKSDKNQIIGFDTGPGMCIVDIFTKHIWAKKYDKEGKIAKKGNINKKLLNYLLKDRFIAKKPPKSATTESYDFQYINKIIQKFKDINNYDILRTFVNFTSVSIKKNIDLFFNENDLSETKIVISGGGVKNKVFFNDFKSQFINMDIKPINNNRINIDNKESFLMCLLGYMRLKRIPNNIPSVTGAKHQLVCGDIYES